jgi:hypothetical protein
MPHRYRITVEHLADPRATPGTERLIRFEVVNHDDLLELIDRMKDREILPRHEVAEFTVGLKLFGEVMLRHRQNPLFGEMKPHFANFMKHLKQGG